MQRVYITFHFCVTLIALVFWSYSLNIQNIFMISTTKNIFSQKIIEAGGTCHPNERYFKFIKSYKKTWHSRQQNIGSIIREKLYLLNKELSYLVKRITQFIYSKVLCNFNIERLFIRNGKHIMCQLRILVI